MTLTDEMLVLLEKAFPGGDIQLSSRGGDNVHFQVTIVHEAFRDKSMVEQHQLVYGALGDAMREAVHALSIKTYPPS